MLTLFTILLSALILGYAIWFLLELARYIHSGDYDVDQRLRDLSR